MDTRNLSLPVSIPAGDESNRCIERLQDALLSLKGVEDAAVNNARNIIRIVYYPDLITFSRIHNEARRTGVHINAQVQDASFRLHGLESRETADEIEATFSVMDGVLWASISVTTAQIHIEFDGMRLNVADLIGRLSRFGVAPELLGAPPLAAQGGRRAPAGERRGSLFSDPWFWGQIRRQVLLAVALLLAIFGALIRMSGDGVTAQQIARGLFAAATLLAGRKLLRSAWKAVRARRVGDSTLLTAALVGGCLSGAWGQTACAALLYEAATLAQAIALERLRRNAAECLTAPPNSAMTLRNGKEESTPAAQVVVGDVIVVRPGDCIPLDGFVLEGFGAVNQSALTGDSRPIDKEPGEPVFAGSRNGESTLKIRVTRLYAESLQARIVHTMAAALAQRAEPEEEAGRIARQAIRWLLPLSVAVALLPPLGGAGDYLWHLPIWCHRGLALLLLANPAALLLAAPVAIAAALGAAGRRGILIKSGAYVEALASARAIVYGKTGALTRGRPHLEEVIPLNTLSAGQILGMAAALEHDVAHPLAQAIREEARHTGAQSPCEISDHKLFPGLGIRGMADGVSYLVGSVRLFQNQKIDLPRAAQEVLAEVEDRGKTAVLVGSGQALYGILLFRDTPRPESRSVIARLRTLGVLYQALLAGDSRGVAAGVANAVGLEEYHGHLVPDQKLNYIRALQERYRCVALVGDGITDAPALAAADVGVVMAALGSERALDAADIAVADDNLAVLIGLRILCRQAYAAIQQNFSAWIVAKCLLAVAILFTQMPLWLPLLVDLALSLAFIANALRVDSSGPRRQEQATADGLLAASTASNALLELVFSFDKTVDEEPLPGYIYKEWEKFAVAFTGEPIRFGRQSPASAVTIQVEDEAMSRIHGEIRLDGRQPVIVDLRSTNGIRRNGRSLGSLIPVERPVPLRFGDTLLLGRNTRIEVFAPGTSGVTLKPLTETPGRASPDSPSAPPRQAWREGEAVGGSSVAA